MALLLQRRHVALSQFQFTSVALTVIEAERRHSMTLL
jgi:hypothetical protein